MSRGPFGGVPLVAHLRRDAGRLRGLGQLAAFVERVGERLLAVDVLARADRRHRGDGVDVVGRADRDGVDVLRLLVEHLAEILVPPRLREGLERAGGALVVHVAEGDDVRADSWRAVAMSPPPMPPAPIPATLTRSLGARNPAPPRTWRGTIVKVSAVPVAGPGTPGARAGLGGRPMGRRRTAPSVGRGSSARGVSRIGSPLSSVHARRSLDHLARLDAGELGVEALELDAEARRGRCRAGAASWRAGRGRCTTFSTAA